uniref:Uncharacterized protein n=1 Tax=Helianthus annuus TaxID=4232 RepID=A0A251SI79_HELAN
MSAHMWHNSKSRIGEAYFVRFIFSLILSLTQPITPKTLIPKSGAPSILQSLLRRSSRVSSRNRIVSSNLFPIDIFKGFFHKSHCLIQSSTYLSVSFLENSIAKSHICSSEIAVIIVKLRAMFRRNQYC